MATEVVYAPAPSDKGGSGVSGVDTASVEWDSAPKPVTELLAWSIWDLLPSPVRPTYSTNKEILRLSIKRIGFDQWGDYFKGELVILRAAERKVELLLPLGRNEHKLLLIDLDRVVLVPRTGFGPTDFECTLQEQENSKLYGFEFETIQDLFRFQEVFTGYRAQILIKHVDIRLQPKGRESPAVTRSDVQLWRKVPNRFGSLVHAHGGLRTLSEILGIGGQAKSPARGEIVTQPHTTIPSDMGLTSINSSVMKRHPSSLLACSLCNITLDGRIYISERGDDVRLVEAARYKPPFASLAQRSSATTSGADGLIALGLTADGSNVQASRLSKDNNSIGQELDRVDLRFRNRRDKIAFVAAFKALRPPHEDFDEADTHGSNLMPLGERGSPTRKHESAVFEAHDVIPSAKQTSAKAELTPLQKFKAEQVDSSSSLSQSRRGLAGESSTHPDGRTAIMPLVAGSLDSKFRPQQALAGNSTIHPDGRADVVPLVAYSLDSALDYQSHIRFMSLQCPFHFLGCKEEFHRGRKQEWVEHSLTHFQRVGRRARLVIFEPPTSLRCNYCETKFSRPSGTACWKDYMNHVYDHEDHRMARLDGHFIDYLWEKGMLTNTEYRELKPVWNSAYNINMDQVPELSSDEDPMAIPEPRRKASGPRQQVFSNPAQFNITMLQPKVGTSAKKEQWRRRICRKIIVFMLWKREQDLYLPTEFWSSPASFRFSDVLQISPLDKIKGLFETYSGREWDWWPFEPPAKPLESGKVRIRWQCTCGDHRWTDASRYLARKCQALINENTAAGHESGNATSPLAGSAANHSHFGSVVPGSFPSDTSQPTGVTSNIPSPTQARHIQDTNKLLHSKDLYVLLCIYQGSQILHSQILASICKDDEAFFENLRQEYRCLRGFFRFWFSPLQFSHCDFVKFTRFYVNELAKVGHSLPIDLVYQYNPRPPGPHEDPPISPHEFRRRFYTHFANPCGRDEALERIPKRQKRFQVNLHVDGREDMWGLHVELRPCFLVVLIWQIVITAGGWAFMGWWLSSHKGDLQNAAVPVTLIVTAVMALWAPMRKGMTEAL